MNNKEFISDLSKKMGYTMTDTQKLVSVMIDTMCDAMCNGFEEGQDVVVGVPGFGSFEVKKKNERVMVMPSSGQRMLVPPKLVLAFKPSGSWKEKVKKGGENYD